jgi:hypothetical protein
LTRGLIEFNEKGEFKEIRTQNKNEVEVESVPEANCPLSGATSSWSMLVS